MKPFFTKVYNIEKNPQEILEQMKTITVHACDRSRSGQKAEFRGYIWDDGFMVWKNINYRNSFNAVAKVKFRDGMNGPEAEVKVGMNMVVFLFTCLWTAGVLFFGIEMTYILADDADGNFAWTLPAGVFVIFMAVLFVFLRFGFMNSYKKLKSRITELLL